MTGIYRITSKLKGRKYIGSAKIIKYRWQRHKSDLSKGVHHSRLLQRHYNKYGLEDLFFEIIETCTEKELLEREQHYLDEESPIFNSCPIAGNCKGSKRSQEFKDRVSRLNKGSGNPTYGLERTPEWRENLSKANKGQKAWNKGKIGIYSDDALLAMSVARKNRPLKQCPYCPISATEPNFSRWHDTNCKNNPNRNQENAFTL